MRKDSNSRNRRVLPIVVLAVLTFTATRAEAQSDEMLTLDIQPQEAGSALVELARASGLQIILAGADGINVRVEGLMGEYRLEDALATLLTDTGLTYEFSSQEVVVVKEVEREPEPETADEAAAEDEDDKLELKPHVVTGSRLTEGDPTARVYSFSAEDIAIRGVSSLEDFFRTLHSIVPTMTSQTSTSPYVDDFYEKHIDDMTKIGISTINLRHMGSANTLVLLNGRRIAGLAGDFDNLFNVLGMPLAAIERVEIQLDGASAVYGSDAIGGVVNFITKKGYRGGSATYREESSSSDSDRRTLSLKGGIGWRSGNVTATLSRGTFEPINHLKLWTTQDWRPIFGPEFDRRLITTGQPGVVCNYNNYPYFPRCSWPPNRRALPQDHSGVGATPEDYSEPSRNDLIWPQNGSTFTRTSLSTFLEQNITDSLRLYADVLVSRFDAQQHEETYFRDYVVPASNAYNPFGEHVVVNYIPRREVESGLITPAHQESENESRNVSAGLFWQFGDGHELELNAARSKSTRSSWRNWHSYYRAFGDPTAQPFYDALASPDPDRALNLFGNGTVQGNFPKDLFQLAGLQTASTEITRFEPLLRGQLFRVWGGPIEYALGAEYRRIDMMWYLSTYGKDGLARITDVRYGRLYDYGTEEPRREMQAYFFELAFPVIGSDNERPGLRSLVLSVQARHDTHSMKGAAGGRVGAHTYEFGTEPYYVPGVGWEDLPSVGRVGHPFYDNYEEHVVESRESAISPRIGVRYSPVESFTLRAAWSKSFTPPNFADVFSPESGGPRIAWYRDPYNPDGQTGWSPYPTLYTANGLHLNPEYSDNYSISFDWTPGSVPGLRWTMDWTYVDFTDKIVSDQTLLIDSREETFKLPEFVERDADGYITLIRSGSRNIAEQRNQQVNTQLEYAFGTRVGGFIAGLNYTRILDEYFQITPAGERVRRVGTVRGTNKYRLTGSLSWDRGRFGANMFVYHTPGYLNDDAGRCYYRQAGRCPELGGDLPDLDVDSLTTVDITLTYRFDNGLQLRAGGRNIFLAKSPTVWWKYQYDPTRWDGRGRVLFLELNWEM